MPDELPPPKNDIGPIALKVELARGRSGAIGYRLTPAYGRPCLVFIDQGRMPGVRLGGEFTPLLGEEVTYTFLPLADPERTAGRQVVDDPVTAEGMQRELAKLREFKAYVHRRLDEAGVPADPDPVRTAASGCRIGPRLDVVLKASPAIDPGPPCAACGRTEDVRKSVVAGTLPICGGCFMVWYEEGITDPAALGRRSNELRAAGKFPFNNRG